MLQKIFPCLRTYIRSKVNPWSAVFAQGTPSDLQKPYKATFDFIDVIKEKSSKKVLDIGVGDGRHIVLLAKNKFETYGFDISVSSVKKTQWLINHLNLKANIQMADMYEQFPYKDNFFDGILAVQVLYHGTHLAMKKSLNEISRVLKPGGYCLITFSTNRERASKGATKKISFKIEKHSFLPITGREKLLIHNYFGKNELEQLLSKYFSHVIIKHDRETQYYIAQCWL